MQKKYLNGGGVRLGASWERRNYNLHSTVTFVVFLVVVFAVVVVVLVVVVVVFIVVVFLVGGVR